MKKLAQLFCITLFFFLTACVAMQKEVKNAEWTYNANPSTGAVLLSVVEEPYKPDAKACLCPSISYRLTETKQHTGYLKPCDAMSCNFQPGDFSDEQGKLYLLELPAGNYEFYNFRIMISTGMGYNEITAKNEFSMPFQVEAGKVKYVGEVRMKDVMGKNLLGLSVPAGVIPSVSDKHERDLATAKTLYPKILPESVVIDVKPSSPLSLPR